jgi:hypothetical protein
MKQGTALERMLRASVAERELLCDVLFRFANRPAYRGLPGGASHCVDCGRAEGTPHRSGCLHHRAFDLAISLGVTCPTCSSGIYSHVHRSHCGDGPEEGADPHCEFCTTRKR